MGRAGPGHSLTLLFLHPVLTRRVRHNIFPSSPGKVPENKLFL